MARASAAPPAVDVRSVTLQQVLRAKWQNTIKKMSPRERERWLDGQEGRTALSAKECNQLLKTIRKTRSRMARIVCSAAWLDAWDHHNDPAGQPDKPRDLVYPPPQSPERKNAVRMVLGRGLVRHVIDGHLIETHNTRRWTPPQAVGLEDYIDGMSVDEATLRSTQWEQSPSAVVIFRIEKAKATPSDGNW